VAGRRRKARILALQALFERDTVGHPPQDVVDRLQQETAGAAGAATFSRQLVEGVIQNRKTIDETIRKLAPAWPIEQIAVVDRNILRLAIYEILIDNKVPMRAAINEAVELAKIYGGENSPKFINGVLGAVSARTAAADA
jgi:N utilization substance protein B